ncbi:MAG: 30S ribosomal protein S9 [Candidatus Ryanbacteria bacterium RIFCSPHIGHO2_01_FULL_45_22]|uniref:Small ribosomal subunit protein uS9 n=2 Tax=Candidatus Ryaniibacteriota TaxID=1817914 RepID=A0A1G2G0W3_9BACT|nr:MAG: 30S ribosomal protein S9 [Candidatus Ryanbacteria bacterium RIFCSPHIGHO2_01_FULL_45_22]OGZ46391.1 MAG: 30S ribosomal protein S9 [Candidatus Ryanbacteria bacterium RIFCSPHIGHO2_02_FULL_45_13b]
MAIQKKTKTVAESYSEGIGRRKTAIARVRIFEKGTGITINNKDYRAYFGRESLARIVKEALETAHKDQDKKVSVHVSGGGIQAQAEAVRHGIARALVMANPEIRKELRSKNLLTRDPRMKERRKFGLKKARRAPQWSKR